MGTNDPASNVWQRLGAEYVSWRALHVLANFGEAVVPPPWLPVSHPGEEAVFEELRLVGYLRPRADGWWGLTPAGEQALLRSLVPAEPTRSELSALELVAAHDLKHRTNTHDPSKWITLLPLRTKMVGSSNAEKTASLHALSSWYLRMSAGKTESYKLSKWGWLASSYGNKARALVDGLVSLFWERFNQEEFEIYYALADLQARGAVSQDTDPGFVEDLIAGFELGRGNSDEGWTFSEAQLTRFVDLECSSGDEYLDQQRVREAAERKIVGAANTRLLPSMLCDLEPVHLLRRMARIARQEPPSTPEPKDTPGASARTVERIVEQFRHLVEDRDLWREMWDTSGKPRHEATSQRLFYAVAAMYCKAHNLDITPEADTGRGRVDFKISSGFSDRLLVEVKLSTNSGLEHGYQTQLRLYRQAEQTTRAIYLVVDVGEMGQKLEKIRELEKRAQAQGEVASRIVVVNAQRRDSASKANTS